MSKRWSSMSKLIGEFVCHYSGGHSTKFWKRVNALPYPQRSQLYAMGCILQNVESAVLRELADVQFALQTDPPNELQELDDHGTGDWVSFPLKWYLKEAEPGEYSITLRVLRSKKKGRSSSSRKKRPLHARSKA